jgi:ferric-dicitrate binding protein FerR (iron transport regulator)
MPRSSRAERRDVTDFERRRTAAPEPAAIRAQARFRALNEDWLRAAPDLERPRPDPPPAPRRRRSRWPLVALLAVAGIGLALGQAAPWIDRAQARLGAAMARALRIDCLGHGSAGATDRDPICR